MNLFESVTYAQPQQPDLSASGLSALVYCNPMQSSATVGCIPTHESSYYFVIPHFIAIPSPYVTSPAFGDKMWNPTTLLLSNLFTITFTYEYVPSGLNLFHYHSKG